MSSKKEIKIKAIPDTLKQRLVEVKFALNEADVGKSADEVFKVEDDLMLSQLSKNSLHNGLIMGDRILKINGVPVKNKAATAVILRGGEFVLEVSRRENVFPVPADRMKIPLQPGHSYFIVLAVRFIVENYDIGIDHIKKVHQEAVVEPPQLSPTAPLGMTIKAVKNRALLTNIEPGSVTSMFFAMGDSILDFDGALIPFNDTAFIREEIGKFQKNGKFTTLVERPINAKTMNEFRRYLLSIMPVESDVEMAADVKAIGLEASNMHAMIFKKLKPPSILTSEVRKKSKANKVSATEAEDKNIKISTASTEMRITSDVEDEDDLKDVVKKSHAASATAGFFDDE